MGVVLSTIGLTIGSFLAFSLSRFFGRPLTERFVDAKTMERFDYLLHHKGAFLVFLLFLIPGFPKDYLCYILGLGHLTTLEFLSIATTGRLLGTMLLTLGGSFLRNHQYYRFFLLSGGGGGHRLPDHRLPGPARAVLPEASRTAPSEEGEGPGAPT